VSEQTTIVAAANVPTPRTSSPETLLATRIRFCAMMLLSIAGAIEAIFNRNTMNPDGICYLDMGDAMWRGDWHMAINGYWSPLYPWIEGLALKLFHPTAYSQYSVVHFVNFLIYLFALYCFDLFLRSLVTNRDRSANSKPNTDWLPNWAVFLVGYAVFFWASLSETRMETVSPDLLMAGFLYLGVSVLLKIWAQPQNSSLYVLLGATLGLGYLAKAPFFPLAFVFFALALILTRNLRKCIPRVAAAFLVFLVVAGPWIVGLSRAKNRITFGDSGKVNYVMWVNGASPAYYFVTLGTAAGRYSHSLRQISSTPVIYEFASPVQGTLPIWYDASYWADGAVPRVLFRRQLAVVKEWLSFYLEKLITSQVALLVGFLVLAFIAAASFLKPFAVAWPAWLIGVLGLGMYALVHVEKRYIAVLFALFWVGLYSGLKGPVTNSKRQIASVVVVGVALAMAVPTGISVLRDLAHIKGPPNRIWRIAEDLRMQGVKPGDRVARIGGRFGTVYWARLLGVTVVAEIPLACEKDFWNASPQVQAQVIDKFRRLGVTAIVGDMTSTDEVYIPGPEWHRLGTEGKYYALTLVPPARD